jgi:predicted CoA-binding protein
MIPQTTLVLGASTKVERYAYKAIQRLRAAGHPVVALGRQEGQVGDITIQTDPAQVTTAVHTVSLYLSPQHQEGYREWLLALRPERVLFNPGTENPSLSKVLRKNGIATENACTLVLLSTNQY